MALETAALRRNLNRYEMALVVVLLGGVVAFFSQKMQRVEAEMDRAATELMIKQIRNGLRIFQMEKIAAGRYAQLAELEGRNPFVLLEYMPSSYAGELDGDYPDRVQPGQWYFDSKDGLLIYRVINDRFFRGGLPGAGRIRLRLKVNFTDRDGNGRYDAGVDSFQGLSLEAMDHYHWMEN